MRQETMGFWDAVTSAGPYVNLQLNVDTVGWAAGRASGL